MFIFEKNLQKQVITVPKLFNIIGKSWWTVISCNFYNLGWKSKYHWDLPVFKEFIGRKLYEEIQLEINSDTEIVPNRFKFESRTSFLPWLQRKIVILQDFQEYLYWQKQADRPPNYICLDCGTNCHQDLIQNTQNEIQKFQRKILGLIEIEFNAVRWITAKN